MTILC